MTPVSGAKNDPRPAKIMADTIASLSHLYTDLFDDTKMGMSSPADPSRHFPNGFSMAVKNQGQTSVEGTRSKTCWWTSGSNEVALSPSEVRMCHATYLALSRVAPAACVQGQCSSKLFNIEALRWLTQDWLQRGGSNMVHDICIRICVVKVVPMFHSNEEKLLASICGK